MYRGEYYTFGVEPKKRKALKAAMEILGLLIVLAYGLTFSLTGSNAPRVFIGAGMLIVIPAIYLLIGLGCLLSAGERLTYRDYRGSVIRIRWTAITIAALAGICILGEAVRLCMGLEPARLELWWFAGNLFCSVTAGSLALLERRFHPRLVPPELK